jgi:nucleoside-diphosphate-sugar epimerase
MKAAGLQIRLLGAGGFIGRTLAAALASEGRLGGQPIADLWLCDRQAPPPPTGAACRVHGLAGDLRDPAWRAALFEPPVDVVFHFAAMLTLAAEADPAAAFDLHVAALADLLAHGGRQASPPRLLFASSISTFGGPLPPVVDDRCVQRPTTTYGVHKLVAEQLIADASRHGRIDGRSLRLPIVLAHPGPGSGSVSDQVAALLREPLRGRRTVCRLAPDTPLAVAAVDTVVAAFQTLATLPAAALAGDGMLNLPALTVTPAQLLAALGRLIGRPVHELVDWTPDAALQRIVGGWPARFTSARAAGLGLPVDRDVDALVGQLVAQLQRSGA